MITSVVTWTELECGCTSSDDGWWVVNVRCQEHRHLVPADALVWMTAPGKQYGRCYGPVEGG